MSRTISRARTGALAACAAAVLMVAAPSSAQHFGRNKVQFKTFDFQVMKTPHFDVYFYPSERAGAEIASRLAERWYARLARMFRHELKGRQPLVLYASQADFAQTNIVQDELGEGTGGFTEPLRRRIVLPFGASIADTDHVVGHELVHAFQYDIASQEEGLALRGVEQLPLWFVEGMAEYISVGPVDANTAMWVRDAMARDSLPTIEQLDSSKYFPYRWGQAFWAYVAGRWGDNVVPAMMIAAAKNGDVESAIEGVLEIKTKELSAAWQAAIRDAYAPVLGATMSTRDIGRVLVNGAELTSELNVGPALSPDGRWLAFLSSRSLFSVDLYVADVATGAIVRRLTRTATNPHVASLQFIYSAAAWDPTSTRVAVATMVAGRPTLTVFDALSGTTEREWPVASVDEILNPTWSPDGLAIAFSGLRGGMSDLYCLDLRSGAIKRLTDDAYADLQPDWSPDGRTIAFVSDRFSTDLTTLATGAFQLVLLNVETGGVRPATAFQAAALDPQWAPDSATIYFTAAPDGVANLYKLTLATGRLTRLTNVATGVSGIASSSPSISVARTTGAVAFSVYDRGTQNIYMLAPESQLDRSGTGQTDAAALPPLDRKPSDVVAMLKDATFGLPNAGEHTTSTPSSGFGLEGVGQPFLGIGASQYGVAFGGGVSFYFSDMMRNHVLGTTVQFNSLAGDFTLKDTAAQVAYLNQAHRWHWGIAAGQSPNLSGAFASAMGAAESGELVQIEQTIVDRQTERSISGIAAYPLDRARRLEFSSGITRISFEQTAETNAYSLTTGSLVATETLKTSGTPLTLASSTAALVGDTSVFGVASPMQGNRYRFEAGPTFGAMNFTSALADYRHYFMPVRLYTIATRAVYYGRLGAGGEDSRLPPLYLGYPGLVRGYDVNSIDVRECEPTATSACPIFDRLLGSRMLVGNVELRFPLLRPFGEAGALRTPIEVALFADGGFAWNRAEGPALFGGSRDGVSSTGVTLRLNLGGFAVAQMDFARPLQRPQQGWMFQFNLTPGF